MALAPSIARSRMRETVYQPISTRATRTSTPDELETAIRAAEGGDLLLAADLARDIERDDRAGGVLRTRTLGLLSLPLHWDGVAPEGWAKLAPIAELLSLHRWGLLFGVGFAQILPNGQLDTWHPRHFRYDSTCRQWYVRHVDGESPIYPGDGEWIIYTPYGAFEPWTEGLWNSLAIPFMIKNYAIHDRARASEVFGSAMIAGTAPEGATDDQRNTWLAKLKALARSSRLVLPDGFKLELIEAQGQTWGIYDKASDWADAAMTISIAGQIVTTEGQSGFSSGDIHEAISHSLIKFGAETLSECLAEQYVPHVWDSTSVPGWDITPPKKIQDEAIALGELGKAIASLNKVLNSEGLKVDVRQLASTYAIPTRRLLAQRAQQTIQLAPTDMARVVKANEARQSMGLGVWTDANGEPSDAGELSITAFALVGEAQDRANDEPPKLVAASSRRRGVQLLRFAKAADVSKAPAEFRLFEAGLNQTDHGDFYFTKQSAKAIMAALGNRDLMIDLEHLSLETESINFDPDAYGWAKLEVRNGELWATNVRWTSEGAKRIRSKKQRWTSPAFSHHKKTNVITALVNVALTALPAMHNNQPLIAATNRKAMDWAQLLESLGLASDATLEDVMVTLAEMQRAAAAGAEEMGADDAADAIDDAASAADDAADIAADADVAANTDDDDDDEDDVAANVDDDDDDDADVAANVAKLVGMVMKLSGRIDKMETGAMVERLDLTPKQRSFMSKLPPKIAREYAKTHARKPRKRGGRGATNSDGLTQEEIAFCRKTNTDMKTYAASKKKVAARKKGMA